MKGAIAALPIPKGDASQEVIPASHDRDESCGGQFVASFLYSDYLVRPGALRLALSTALSALCRQSR